MAKSDTPDPNATLLAGIALVDAIVGEAKSLAPDHKRSPVEATQYALKCLQYVKEAGISSIDDAITVLGSTVNVIGRATGEK